jgi:hypothetical protein
MKENLNQEGLV